MSDFARIARSQMPQHKTLTSIDPITAMTTPMSDPDVEDGVCGSVGSTTGEYGGDGGDGSSASVSKETSAVSVPTPCTFLHVEPRMTCKSVSPRCTTSRLARDEVIAFGL